MSRLTISVNPVFGWRLTLHATVCANLSLEHAHSISESISNKLRNIGPISFKVRGLFSGNVNIGRLYLKVYPEKRSARNMCHEIQKIFSSSTSDLYVVGLFNLTEELNAKEANELMLLIERWWDVDFVHLKMEFLWRLKSKDDLVLDGSIDRIISLV